MSLSVHMMKSSDFPDIQRIERLSYDFPWSEELLKNCLKVGYHGLVLKDNGNLRGFAFASTGAGEAHILNLCIDPEFRRHGYASALLHQAIATVIAHGAKVIFLEVRESNTAAIALYESSGFVEIGRRENYYRKKSTGAADKVGKNSKRQAQEDALVMSRDLSFIDDASDI